MEGLAMGQHISYGRREQTGSAIRGAARGKGPGVVVLQGGGLVGPSSARRTGSLSAGM
jgi:hypothetical protein